MRKVVKVSGLLMVGIIACSFSLNAQNKETQCEQFYKDAKKAYDKGDYEVALIFFNRCKAEGCKNADFQIYIDVCNMKLGKKSSVATTDGGIEINGVIWATCNVDVPGKFATYPQNKGNYYTWKESQNVCPTGWRLPTKEEFESLINFATPVFSELNRINGFYFGSGEKVFFPSYNSSREATLYGGAYWSSSIETTDFVYCLHFLKIVSTDREPSIEIESHQSNTTGIYVRCVKK